MKNIVKSTSNESLLKISILEMSGSDPPARSQLQIQNNFSEETFHVLYPKLTLYLETEQLNKMFSLIYFLPKLNILSKPQQGQISLIDAQAKAINGDKTVNNSQVLE